MHFTDLVRNTGVEQDTFGGRGLTCVNVSRDTEVAITRDRGSTSHYYSPKVEMTWSPFGHHVRLIKLETEMRESLVSFCHAVNFITLLHGGATAFSSIQQLTS